MPFDGITARQNTKTDWYSHCLGEELDVLIRAREQLTRPGAWIKKVYFKPSSSPDMPDAACAVGHLLLAAADAGYFSVSPLPVLPRVVDRIVGKFYPGGGTGLMRFNDDDQTTQEHILAWFDHAIDFTRRHKRSVDGRR